MYNLYLFWHNLVTINRETNEYNNVPIPSQVERQLDHLSRGQVFKLREQTQDFLKRIDERLK